MRLINYLSLIVLITVFSCQDKQEGVQPQTELGDQKTIQKFSISIDGKEYEGTLEDNVISVSVPYSSDITVIRPNVSLAQGFSISPTTSEAVDFSKPVKYVVKNPKGELTTFTVIVKIKSSELAITDLELADQLGKPQIDTAKHTITVNVSGLADLSTIGIKSITSSPGTTVDPSISKVVDFSANSSAKFIVKDKEGHSKEWTVTIVKVLVNANDILSFEVEKSVSIWEKLPVTIDPSKRTIKVFYLNGTDLRAVHVLSIGLSPGATIVGGTPLEINLSYDASLVVQAQNGEKQTWKIVGVNQGLSNKTVSDMVIAYYSSAPAPTKKVLLAKTKITGYDFLSHKQVGTSSSYFDPSVVENVDIHPFINGDLFQVQAGKIDDTHLNTTQYVVVPKNVQIDSYEEMKLRFESSPNKVSSIRVGDFDTIIAKVRGMDYYVLIEVRIYGGTGDQINITFDYKY